MTIETLDGTAGMSHQESRVTEDSSEEIDGRAVADAT
jgi:hypothetical protein